MLSDRKKNLILLYKVNGVYKFSLPSFCSGDTNPRQVCSCTAMENQRQTRAKPPSFKIELPGNAERKNEISEKLRSVRGSLQKTFNRPVTNSDILDAVLDFWIQSHVKEEEQETFRTSFSKVGNQRDTNEKLFISTVSSLQKSVELAEHHERSCKYSLKQQKIVHRGHVIIVTFQCSKAQSPHTYRWSSSPYLPNDTFLVNHKINHAVICSGMLPVHYTRFANASGTGVISKTQRKKFLQEYSHSLQSVYDSSLQESLHLEISSCEELDGIDIMADARHGWRKNAKDSSIVAKGDILHKVLQCIHITKADDMVSQRHKLKGTQRIYEHFETQDVTVKVHTHDRNMSVNKLVKSRAMTVNQNDRWHGVKSLKRSMQAISAGPKYKEGKFWFDQLSDKVQPVATHFHWAIRNCQNDPQRLRKLLSNI